jgi:hypothetical protein
MLCITIPEREYYMRLVIVFSIVSVNDVMGQDGKLAHRNVRLEGVLATDDGTDASPIVINTIGTWQFPASGPFAELIQAGDKFEIPLSPFRSVQQSHDQISKVDR